MSIMFPHILLLIVLWPLALAFGMTFRTMRPAVLSLAPWAALPAFLIAVFAPQNLSLDMPWLLLGTSLSIADQTSRLFLLFTALLWWLSGLFARAYLSGDSTYHRFFCYFLLAMTGNLGLTMAQDSPSFYLFFALMSFSSYGLVAHERSVEALRAGKIYMLLVVIGELALFVALVLATTAIGSTAFDSIRVGLAQAEDRSLIIALASIGFGIKAGMVGLHVWLPLAHPVAPTPASAVLSGAMIKAGLLGWLRILPLGEVALPQWGEIFIILGIIAAFYGVVVGLTQRVPKTVLAYSSISQMGLMTMAVGLGLMAPTAYPEILVAIVLYGLHHGFSKGTLFIGVGVIGACTGLRRRLIWLGLWLPALALAGAPLTGGMLAKFLLKAQLVNIPAPWDELLQTLLPLSSIATTILVGRFLFLLLKEEGKLSSVQPKPGLVWPWILLLMVSLIMPWLFVPKSPKLWSQAAIFGSLWSVLLGVVLVMAIGLWRFYQRRRSTDISEKRYPAPSIPPGDVLECAKFCFTPVFSLGSSFFAKRLPQWRNNIFDALVRFWYRLDFVKIFGQFEHTLNSWPVALTLLLVFILVIAALGFNL